MEREYDDVKKTLAHGNVVAAAVAPAVLVDNVRKQLARSCIFSGKSKLLLRQPATCIKRKIDRQRNESRRNA